MHRTMWTHEIVLPVTEIYLRVAFVWIVTVTVTPSQAVASRERIE